MNESSGPGPSLFERLERFLFGVPKDIEDPGVFHRISLVAFLAWVGLGADGLSSSTYGPEEAFRMLGQHQYLAVLLLFAVVGTVFVISYAYSSIIEHFPLGGGGYVVASRLLGVKLGVLSGSALLVDYVLTISVSIAAGGDAIFSLLPLSWHGLKLPFEAISIGILTLLNLRGVKESVKILAPIFLLFLLTHAAMILGTILFHIPDFPEVAREVGDGFQAGLATLGVGGLAALFLRAYTMGAGTYTGIEAVSNGLQIMREPKVETGKKTMLYMATSLALTAGGIILCYLLVHAQPVAGRTMNAVLAESFVDIWGGEGAGAGHWFVGATMFAEAALLFVAAQAGFIDGPRVMANMANDSWLPHRFGSLSDRLTAQDGILLVAGASLLTLLYTHGQTHTLVLMYSINVFITFSLTQAGMLRYWLARQDQDSSWRRKMAVHFIGFVLCVLILMVNIYEKFTEGGWVTLVITGAVIALCFLVKRHYNAVTDNLSRLDAILNNLPANGESVPTALDSRAPTAVLMVGGYGGLGIHSLLTIQRLFPNYFKNFIFISVGVIDSATFKGIEEVERIRRTTEDSLARYVRLARSWGLAADCRMSMGIDAVEEAEELCLKISKEFPRTIVFAGKLVFQEEKWFQRLLHNETGYQIQRRLQFSGLSTMVLPVRVLAGKPAPVG